MTAQDQVRGILTKLAALRPEPNFILVGKAKPPEQKLMTIYFAGIGCGLSITFMSAWVSLSLHLVGQL